MKHLSILCLVAALLLASGPARATDGPFGAASGITFEGTLAPLAALDEATLDAVWEHLADLYVDAGITWVRLGAAGEPDYFSWGAIMPAEGTWDFTRADKLVGILVSHGLEVVLTISSTCPWDHDDTVTTVPDDSELFRQYVVALAERYDGDLDFGFDSGSAYPDINNSGEVNVYDWQSASTQERMAWAEAHVVDVYEVGETPSVQEAAGIAPTDYGKVLTLASGAIKSANPALKVMLGTIDADEATEQSFEARMSSLAPGESGELFDIASLQVFGDKEDWTVETHEETIQTVKGWLDELGYTDVPVWIGATAFSSAPCDGFPGVVGATVGGNCLDDRCSEETQVNQLARFLTFAGAAKVTKVFLDTPIEIMAPSVDYGPGYAYAGLMTLPASTAHAATPEVRPAAYLLPLFEERVGRLAAMEHEELGGLAKNTRVHVFTDGTKTVVIAWYDWFLEVPAGTEYGGVKKQVTLEVFDGEAVSVTSVWPQAGVDPSDLDALFPATVLPVTDGMVTVTLGRDVVIITDGELSTPVADGVEPEVVEEVSQEVVVEDDDDGGDDDGCAVGAWSATGRGSGWLVLFAVVFVVLAVRRW